MGRVGGVRRQGKDSKHNKDCKIFLGLGRTLLNASQDLQIVKFYLFFLKSKVDAVMCIFIHKRTSVHFGQNWDSLYNYLSLHASCTVFKATQLRKRTVVLYHSEIPGNSRIP